MVTAAGGGGDDVTLRSVVEILDDVGSATLEELLEELEMMGHECEGRDLRLLLNRHLERFQQLRGRWSVRTEPMGSVTVAALASSDRRDPTTRGTSRSGVDGKRSGTSRSTSTRAEPPKQLARMPVAHESNRRAWDLERELVARLKGVRIIAEVDLSGELVGRVEAEIGRVVGSSDGVEGLASRYPALIATYLVSHGMYSYRGGSFWPSIDLHGSTATAWGREFEDAVQRLDLETFEEMVYGDNALRFVGPILAHGGIPALHLHEYFGLVGRSLRRADDASSMASLWRVRRSPFRGIIKPVQRFLLFGGDVAVGFVDRTIDLFQEFVRARTIPDVADVGLPEYVVSAFREYVVSDPSGIRESRARIRGPKPVVRLDPWSASGPMLELPVLPAADDRLVWRVRGGEFSERFNVSRVLEREVPLGPSRSWEVVLLDGWEERGDHTFEGIDHLPAMFFDPRNGALIRPSGGLTTDPVWVLRPKGTDIEGVAGDGSTRELRIVEKLPDPTGPWSGFVLEELELGDVRSVAMREGADGRWRRLRVRTTGQPVLRGEPIRGVRDGEGRPVWSEVPELVLPPGIWKIDLVIDGRDRSTETIENELDEVQSLPIPAGLQAVHLRVRGPLGGDLRTSFIVCPGLEVARPERVLMPGDRSAPVQLGSPSLSVDGQPRGRTVAVELSGGADGVSAMVVDEEGREADLTVEVARVLWGISDSEHSSLEFDDDRVFIGEDQFQDRRAVSLAVRTGTEGMSLRLALMDGATLLQETDAVRTRTEEGRWVFDLARFGEAVRTSRSPSLVFQLVVGAVPVDVGQVRREVGASNLVVHSRVIDEFTAVDLTFDDERRLTDRVARLWSVSRPWDVPVVEPIPDGQVGEVSISRFGDLPAGIYLAQIDIDDGWTEPALPSVGQPSVQVVAIGTARDEARRWDDWVPVDPFESLERAIVTGRPVVGLDDADWEEIGAAGVIAAARMASGRLPHLPSHPEGFRAVRQMLVDAPAHLASSLVEAVEDEHIDRWEALILAIELASKLDGATRPDLPDHLIRSLWSVAPSVAIHFDACGAWNPDAAARVDEFTGWDPTVEGWPDPGEAVSQQYVGMSAEVMVALRGQLDLIPGRHLILDSLIAAHIEWLLAEKADPERVQGFWRRTRGAALGWCESFDGPASDFLAARVPARGTADWAALPVVTLASALVAMTRPDLMGEATDNLRKASRFAPKLVQRDLVLSRVLTSPRGRYLRPPESGAEDSSYENDDSSGEGTE